MRIPLPVLTFGGSIAGGACSLLAVGMLANWKLGGQPAIPTGYGFLFLGIFGGFLGALWGSLVTLLVAAFMRPAKPRRAHFLSAILIGFIMGLVGAPLWLPLFIHLPIDLRHR
jgi:hypothetical protein